VKLFFRKTGQGSPLIILHGLFGQSDNWNTLERKFSETMEVFTVDLRNHGLSPHSDVWTYPAMSDDLLELISNEHLTDVTLLGHSMGGKVAMHVALYHPEKIARLIVADMSPRYYPVEQDKVIEGLLSVDLGKITSRKEAEDQLSVHISDQGTRQFLLKNLYRKNENTFAWRFNLDAISKNIATIGSTFSPSSTACTLPSLFLRGEHSNYITEEDIPEIKKLFSKSEIETIAGAGHWLHADKPELFFTAVTGFIERAS